MEQRISSVVEKVAASIGIPYQTYMKQVVYKQALLDLQLIEKQK